MLSSQKLKKKENVKNTKFYVNKPRYPQKGPNLQEIFFKWKNIVEAAFSTSYLTRKRGQSIVKETRSFRNPEILRQKAKTK